MPKITILFILLCFKNATAQIMPDSIVVHKNTYVNYFGDPVGHEKFYRQEVLVIVKKGRNYELGGLTIARKKVMQLLTEISLPESRDSSLAKSGIDTNWIKANPGALIDTYTGKTSIAWNKQQRDYISPQLTNLPLYNDLFKEYLSNGAYYTMHSSYKEEYEITMFCNGVATHQITSRKYVWGYKMPWTDKTGNKLFNYNIEKYFDKILALKSNARRPIQGKKLLTYLVNKIVDINQQPLYKLSAYSYLDEINTLKADFDVISHEQVYGYGRYIWDEPTTMKIVLKNQLMLPNVDLVFLDSKYGKTLYTADSIKKDYASIINRIQSIKFISDYLKEHPAARLDIYYFNNSGINKYNIDAVNKNPGGWARHDKWVESLKWDTAHGIKLSFDIDKSIETSKRVDCGCNYRFDREFIAKAVFFEVHDGKDNSSIWFLLPDNTVLLYLMDYEKALNFSAADFGNDRGYMTYPCAIFNSLGDRITK